MKDIVIKGSDIRRECIIFLVCLIVAFLVNCGAIIAYDRPWSELFSQIGYVVFLSFGIYVLLAMVRIVVYGCIRLFNR